MIRLYKSWRESENVPEGWRTADAPGHFVKVPIHNLEVIAALREQLPGRWVKVYRKGRDGTEIHYFEHASGTVANVKYKHKGLR